MRCEIVTRTARKRDVGEQSELPRQAGGFPCPTEPSRPEGGKKGPTAPSPQTCPFSMPSAVMGIEMWQHEGSSPRPSPPHTDPTDDTHASSSGGPGSGGLDTSLKTAGKKKSYLAPAVLCRRWRWTGKTTREGSAELLSAHPLHPIAREQPRRRKSRGSHPRGRCEYVPCAQ
jgi:hypothetical protein